MNSKQLLKRLQAEAALYSVDALEREYHELCAAAPDPSADDYIAILNRRYNAETMLNLLKHSEKFYGDELNPLLIQRFEDQINQYMDRCAPGEESLKSFIRILNTYRAFVAKIPLHPPGMSFSEGKVYQKGNDYYCTAKRLFMNDKGSLCRFCPARLSEY